MAVDLRNRCSAAVAQAQTQQCASFQKTNSERYVVALAIDIALSRSLLHMASKQFSKWAVALAQARQTSACRADLHDGVDETCTCRRLEPSQQALQRELERFNIAIAGAAGNASNTYLSSEGLYVPLYDQEVLRYMYSLASVAQTQTKVHACTCTWVGHGRACA